MVIVAILVTTEYGKNKTAPQINESTMVNEKAIDFTLKDLDGNKISLSDFKGKNVYVNFFATWCPPCRAEMPDIEKMYQKYRDKDFVFLAVDLGEDRAAVKDFFESYGLNFNVVLDQEQTVAQNYNITSIPVSIFIDKQGNIAAKKVGILTGKEMELYIKMLLEQN